MNQECLPSCFLHQQAFEGNQRVFMRHFLNNKWEQEEEEEEGEIVLSNEQPEDELAKVIPFWLF